ncbi:hypothetical protein [Botrimarina mediterranea]|uniref:hypothetical protein n=1 Tax=Botrimarina mediterranea TaxID=2528022 RepID=UPI0011882246|nr:hypothetical protein K2D_06010 [Planctomycetes bacterium K2D]
MSEPFQNAEEVAAWLSRCGVEMRMGSHGGLQTRDREKRLTEADYVIVRQWADELRDLLLNRGRAFEDLRDPEAPRCDRCDGVAFVDVPIHGGASVRRDCANPNCNRFAGFPVWYGAADPKFPPLTQSAEQQPNLPLVAQEAAR